MMKREAWVQRVGDLTRRTLDERRAAARPHVRAALVPVVRSVLAERRLPLEEGQRAADEVLVAVRRAETEARATLARLDRRPISGATTVHAAHARHPAVREVFASLGLPDCPSCAVGADETLAEAALGEGFALDALLDRIRGILTQN